MGVLVLIRAWAQTQSYGLSAMVIGIRFSPLSDPLITTTVNPHARKPSRIFASRLLLQTQTKPWVRLRKLVVTTRGSCDP